MDDDSVSAYALVQEYAASWAEFESLSAALYHPLPQGLVVHLAGPTEEGVRVISVWIDEQSWRRFESERLEPARAALSAATRRLPTSREVRAGQIVLGAGARAERGNQGGRS